MKTLRKYLKNRELAISLLVEKPNHKYTSDTFHKLRVEIKKLDAFFALLKFCFKDFKRKKTFKPFKQIFLQAGKIRELQIEEEMLKKYLPDISLHDYLNYLKRLRLKEQEAFFSIVNKKMAVRLKHKYHEIVPLLSKVNNKKVNRYLEKKITKIKELIGQGNLQAAWLHELRKRLNMLKFNRKSLSLEKQNISILKKDDFTMLLGQWHDSQVIMTHLNKTMETAGLNPKEIIQLEKLKIKLSSDSETVLKKINSILPEYL